MIRRKSFIRFIISVFTLSIGHHILVESRLAAQDSFYETRYTVENGLPHDQVVSINQDTTGFLWIATWDGLSRYDGYEFQNYYHHPEDTTSFPTFIIEKVLIDRANHVLIDCGYHPLSVYDRPHDNFRRIDFNQIGLPYILDCNIGIDKRIWVLDNDFLFLLNDSLQVERKLAMFEPDGRKFVVEGRPQLVIDNTGTKWIFILNQYDYQVYRGKELSDAAICWNRMGNLAFTRNKSYGENNDTENLDIQVTASGETFLFSKYGLFRCDTGGAMFYRTSDHPDPFLFSGKPAFFWSDDSSNLFYVDTRSHKIHQLRLRPGSSTEAAFKDASGNVWAGITTSNREDLGLYRYDLANPGFHHYLTSRDENGDITMVFSVLKDRQGNLWAGTRKDNFLIRIKPPGTVEKIDFSYAMPPGETAMTRTMAGDETGFWMGCTNDFLLFYDFGKGKFEKATDRSNLVHENLTSIGIHNLIDKPGSVLISGTNGISVYGKKDGSLHLAYKMGKTGIIHCFMKAGEPGYWLGIWDNSVLRLNENFEETGRFKLGSEQNLVEHVCPGDSNDLWVALMGGGLGHLYPATGKSEFFTTSDGLSNNVIYSILKDLRGNLWMATNHGISMFNPTSRYFKKFGREEGLLIDEFNSDSWFQSADGEMFFGGVGGFVGFYPDSILAFRESAAQPTLVITALLAAGRPAVRGPFSSREKVTLQKGDDNFQVSFALLDFQHASRIRYRYRLVGDSETWIQSRFQNRSISFNNLTHKTYQLEIQATNQQGEWANSTSMAVTIPHRPVEAIWFRLLIILVFLALAGYVVLLSHRQRRTRTRILEDELRLGSLRGQMNPHFIFNSLNSINYFISNNDKLSANNYIADFSRLIRTTLKNLSLDYIPLEKELESLKGYLRLEHLRFGDRFNYSISHESVENQDNILVPPGLLQPFIENAIWHGIRGLKGRIGIVKVIIQPFSADSLECIIEDDGVGRRTSRQLQQDQNGKKSEGIRIVRDRLDIISRARKKQGDLTIEDLYPEREETGTRVRILLPVRYEQH